MVFNLPRIFGSRIFGCLIALCLGLVLGLGTAGIFKHSLLDKPQPETVEATSELEKSLNILQQRQHYLKLSAHSDQALKRNFDLSLLFEVTTVRL
jgi:hypothetical protein